MRTSIFLLSSDSADIEALTGPTATTMVRNHFKVALGNLVRHKMYGIITAGRLAVEMSVAMKDTSEGVAEYSEKHQTKVWLNPMKNWYLYSEFEDGYPAKDVAFGSPLTAIWDNRVDLFGEVKR